MQDLFSVEAKVALVTGGSRGIGEMIAAGLRAHHAKVSIRGDRCQSVATAERPGNMLSLLSARCPERPSRSTARTHQNTRRREYSVIRTRQHCLSAALPVSVARPIAERHTPTQSGNLSADNTPSPV